MRPPPGKDAKFPPLTTEEHDNVNLSIFLKSIPVHVKFKSEDDPTPRLRSRISGLIFQLQRDVTLISYQIKDNRFDLNTKNP